MYYKCFRVFFFPEVFGHKSGKLPDSIESIQSAALNHIYKMPASRKPGCLLPNRQYFLLTTSWQYTHLCLNGSYQLKFRRMQFLPVTPST